MLLAFPPLYFYTTLCFPPLWDSRSSVPFGEKGKQKRKPTQRMEPPRALRPEQPPSGVLGGPASREPALKSLAQHPLFSKSSATDAPPLEVLQRTAHRNLLVVD